MTDDAQAILDGDRRALARAITLIESTRRDHRAEAGQLLEALMPHTGQSIRVGISGAPGVGKSTFIEAFGNHIVDQGHKVAVLTVDPSSAISGGSILGDKTRMDRLARDPLAFIRPSPSQTHLGGVARRTREAVALCEAAGFDIVLIETVGVGQSETVVAQMSDIFLLLLAPAGGDELQGVKRGIMEIADLILVNKADGDLKSQAMRTCADYAGALRLLRKRPQDPDDFPKALTVSALSDTGLDTALVEIETLARWRKSNGIWEAARRDQARYWFREEVQGQLIDLLTSAPGMPDHLARLEDAVATGQTAPSVAAAEAIARLRDAT